MLYIDFNTKPKNEFNLIGKIKLQIVVSLSVVAGFLIFTQLIFAASLATDGEKVSEIELEIKTIESQNASLKIEIAKQSSFTNLQKKAEDLGFIKPVKVINP